MYQGTSIFGLNFGLNPKPKRVSDGVISLCEPKAGDSVYGTHGAWPKRRMRYCRAVVVSIYVVEIHDKVVIPFRIE